MFVALDFIIWEFGFCQIRWKMFQTFQHWLHHVINVTYIAPTTLLCARCRLQCQSSMLRRRCQCFSYWFTNWLRHRDQWCYLSKAISYIRIHMCDDKGSREFIRDQNLDFFSWSFRYENLITCHCNEEFFHFQWKGLGNRRLPVELSFVSSAGKGWIFYFHIFVWFSRSSSYKLRQYLKRNYFYCSCQVWNRIVLSVFY